MADFLENEAELSEEDAEEGIPTNAEADSSDEEEDENDEYEKDDFIVDEVDEEEEEQTGEIAKRKKIKKKRKKSWAIDLDEDDYQLLEDNTGFKRPVQRKKLKKKGDPSSFRGTRTAAEQLQDTLFGPQDLEDDDLEDEQPDFHQAPADEDIDIDDIDDFIVDEEGGANRQRRQRRRQMGIDPATAAALEDAADIFGDVDALLKDYYDNKDADSHDDEQEDEDQEDEDGAIPGRKAAREKLLDSVDPSVISRHFLSADDEVIRSKDMPERFQLRKIDAMLGDMDLQTCADWVYNKLFHQDADQSFEKQLMEEGVLEVQGQPPYGDAEWNTHDLEMGHDGLRSLGSHRALRKARPAAYDGSCTSVSEWHENEAAQAALKESIVHALTHFFDNMEEVPLVAMFHKKDCGDLLCMRQEDAPAVTVDEESGMDVAHLVGTIQAHHRRIRRWDIMWAVFEHSLRFSQLDKRRNLRRQAYESALSSIEGSEQHHQQLRMGIETCMSELAEAQSLEEINDVHTKFGLLQTQALEAAMQGLSLQGKSAVPRGLQHKRYSQCLQANLHSFLSQMALTAEQVSANLRDGVLQHEVSNPQQPPEEVLQDFVDSAVHKKGVASVSEALDNAVFMAAMELASEPTIRKTLRGLFWQYACVTTTPTDSGLSVLDPFHPLGLAKRLQQKPISSFVSTDLYVKVAFAEKERLINVKLEVPAEHMDKFLEPLRDNYVSSNVSTVAQQYNEIRKRILERTAVDFLLPGFQKEAQQKLLADAQDVVLRGIGDRLWQYATQPQFRIAASDEGQDGIDHPRVMAVCWGSGKPTTTAVVLDETGSLVDVLHLNQLSGNIPTRGGRNMQHEDYNLFEDPRKQEDAKRLKEFIMLHKPHVITVGTAGLECRQLQKDLKGVVSHFLFDDPFWWKNEMPDLPVGQDVLLRDEALARLWEGCAHAIEEFPNHMAIVRRAVALGRSLIDPLAVLTSLCGSGQEVLSLHLHTLQLRIPAVNRLRVIEQILVTAVNQVGVDVNLAANVPWKASTLQFVCGLGPRKAQAMLRAIQAQHYAFVESRKDLFRELGIVGMQVLRNCAPFLRVTDEGLMLKAMKAGNFDFDKLDDTRIPPEAYECAQELAKAAVQQSNEVGDDEDWVLTVMERGQVLDDFDLVDFDERTADMQRKPDFPGLIDITMEFMRPYGDMRPAWTPMTMVDEFHLLMGDADGSLKPGVLVTAVVFRVNPYEAFVRLESGLEAKITPTQVSSNPPRYMSDRLAPKQTISARIESIDYDEFTIVLTCRSADLADNEAWEKKYCEAVEPHYHIPTQEEAKADRMARLQRAKRQPFLSRPIKHPLFKNVSQAQAVEELKSEEVAACIIRPSTKGSNFLAVSIKLLQGMLGPIIVHTDIKEGPKGSGAGAHLKLGLPLTVEMHGDTTPQQFEDLDELHQGFVESFAQNVQTVVKHRKFKDGTIYDVEQEVLKMKERNPAQAAYLLAPMYERPGLFQIVFCTGTHPHHEALSITNKGFYFRRKVYTDIERLLYDFKKQPVNPERPQQQYPGMHGAPHGGMMQQYPSNGSAYQPHAPMPYQGMGPPRMQQPGLIAPPHGYNPQPHYGHQQLGPGHNFQQTY